VCGGFAVHARTTVTFDGTQSTVVGNVGVSPGTSITGSYAFDPIAVGSAATGGVVSTSDSAAFAETVRVAQLALVAVQVEIVMGGLTFSGPGVTNMAIEMGGLTFPPGIHRSGSAINFAHGTEVTLDAEGDPNATFLFQAGTTLVTAADTKFNLVNGAKAENVIWALGSAATLGARSVVEGSILAGTAITFGTGSVLNGCALAQSAVTFESGGTVNGGMWGTLNELNCMNWKV
jgi:hypothetical protein